MSLLTAVVADTSHTAAPDLTMINPPWENVVFQMPMNTLLDQTRRHEVTANGNALIQSTTTILGYPCAYFDGVGDYLSTPYSLDFNPESGNFTAECWVIPSSLGNRSVMGFASSGGGNSLWALGQTSADIWQVIWFNGTSHESIDGGVVTVNRLTHLKFERVGQVMSLYQDGVQISSASRSSTSSFGEASQLSIGRMGDYDGQYFQGFIGGIRIAKGWASGQEAFLPPVSAFDATPASNSNPAWGGVVFASHFDTSKGMIDESPSMASISPVNGAALSTVYTKFGTSSLRLNGQQGVTISKQFLFYSDFTLELWVRPENNYIYLIYDGSGIYQVLTQYIDLVIDAGVLGLRTGGNYRISHQSAVSMNNWNHISIVREGGVFALYLNGVRSSATYSYSGITGLRPGSQLGFFSIDSAWGLIGNIDEVIFTNGVALYSSDICAVPSTEFVVGVENKFKVSDPNFQNVILAMPFDDAGIESTYSTAGGVPKTEAEWVAYQNEVSPSYAPWRIIWSEVGAYVMWSDSLKADTGRGSAYVLYRLANKILGLTKDLAGNMVTINGTGLSLDGSYGAFGKDYSTDPYWNKTTLAMHMDSSFTDARANTTSNYGAAISTPYYKYGGGSGDFAAGRVSVGSASDWTFLNSGESWTVDCWVRHTAYASRSDFIISTQNGASNMIGMTMAIYQGAIWIYVYKGVTSSFQSCYATFPEGNDFHYVEASYSSIDNRFRIFIDGVLLKSELQNASIGFVNSTPQYALNIGGAGNGIYPFQGQIDDLRITKGIARHTVSFIPPKASFSEAQEKSYYAALYGRGEGWLTVPGSSKFTFTGDFTISGWVWGNGDKCLFSNWRFGYASECGYYLSIVSGTVYFAYGVGATNVPIAHPSALKASAPNHLAVTRKDGVIRIFVNGISSSPTTVVGVLNTNTLYKRIGGQTAKSDATQDMLNGYMDDLFVCNGWAKWDSDFYPPMQRGVAQSLYVYLYQILNKGVIDIGGTLVLSAFNGAIADATGRNAVTTAWATGGGFTSANIAAVKTTSSISSVPYSSDFDFGVDDFTVRVKINMPADMPAVYENQLSVICAGRRGTGGWNFNALNAGGKYIRLECYNGGANTALVLGQAVAYVRDRWYCLEFGRKNGVSHGLIDGVSLGFDGSIFNGVAINASSSHNILLGVCGDDGNASRWSTDMLISKLDVIKGWSREPTPVGTIVYDPTIYDPVRRYYPTFGIRASNYISNDGKLTLRSAVTAHARVTLDAQKLQDFDATFEVKIPAVGDVGMTYRSSYVANSEADTFGYVAHVTPSSVIIARGGNSATASYTPIMVVDHGLSTGVAANLRITVRGLVHQVYINGMLKIGAVDLKHSAAGDFGLRVYNEAGVFDNLTITEPSTLGAFTKNWASGIVTMQTSFGTGASQYVDADGKFVLSGPSSNGVSSRLNELLYADFDASFDMAVTAVGDSGFNYRTTGNGWTYDCPAYYVCISSDGNLRLYRNSNATSSTWTYFAVNTHGVPTGQMARVRVVAVGSRHQVYVNDVLKIDATDSTHMAAGQFGFRVYNCSVKFDNLTITPIQNDLTKYPQVIAYGDSGPPDTGKTSLSFTIPVTANAGDTILVGLTRRSAATAPTGFRLISEAVAPEGAVQWTSMYAATVGFDGVDAGDVVTFTQAASSRFALAWFALRDVYKESVLPPTLNGMSIPTAIASRKGIYISFCGSYYASTGWPTTFTPPLGHTLKTTGTVMDNRFAVATKDVVTAESVSGTYVHYANDLNSHNGLNILAVLVE